MTVVLHVVWVALGCACHPHAAHPRVHNPLSACPADGRGAIVAPAGCFVVTPAALGAQPSGANADENHYILEPAGTPRGELVLFLNASLATPAAQIADAKINLYSTLAAAGFHVVALSYRSTAIIAMLCRAEPECFGPSRETLVLGEHVAGAASGLTDMRADEGIVPRLDALLSTLARERADFGWGRFVAAGASAAEHIAWAHVTATGHSQGGGHAAYLGRLFAMRRVVQLSSTCDQVGGVPAPWTRATEPWATAPRTSFYGLSVPTTFAGRSPSGGDVICAYHAAVWANMGMDTVHQHDDAETCAGSPSHIAPLQCTVNASRWLPLFN